jgi:hypothetical protein
MGCVATVADGMAIGAEGSVNLGVGSMFSAVGEDAKKAVSVSPK